MAIATGSARRHRSGATAPGTPDAGLDSTGPEVIVERDTRLTDVAQPVLDVAIETA